MKLRDKLRGLIGLEGNLPAMALSEMISNTGWNMFEVNWQPYVLGLGASMSILNPRAAIVVGLVICFAGSYMMFLRSEIRPGE